LHNKQAVKTFFSTQAIQKYFYFITAMVSIVLISGYELELEQLKPLFAIYQAWKSSVF
jgi:hypothetical protein